MQGFPKMVLLKTLGVLQEDLIPMHIGATLIW
jgi:hypothetical protein